MSLLSAGCKDDKDDVELLLESELVVVELVVVGSATLNVVDESPPPLPSPDEVCGLKMKMAY